MVVADLFDNLSDASESSSAVDELRVLAAAVTDLQDLDLDGLEPRELLVFMRELERLRRRIDAGTDRLVDRCDTTAAYVEDGHRSSKPCVKHLGRLSGREAHGRVQTARQLRSLPAVADAYASGMIPTEMVRAICRVAANPRVSDFLSLADPIFAELASEQDHDKFIDWLKQWEALADADGAAEASQHSHERRKASLWRNDMDGTTIIEGHVGDVQGVVMADIFDAFCAAELESDLAWAKANLGDDFALDELPRTAAQRRADALFAIFRRAMAQPSDARSPEPLVSIVVDEETVNEEIRRTSRAEPTGSTPSPSSRADKRICHTIDGEVVHPTDALAAMLVGYVRRVVVDASGTVIDLGRKRRLFTGSSREAALLQCLIQDRGGTGCRWPGCDVQHRRLQVDHRQSWTKGGPTRPANSQTLCGVHNRLKESDYIPIRGPDGTWTIQRPDGTNITPPA